ncbi:hypothetical protein ACFXAO_39580 [Streptomyces lavendulae]|uniref:hypothetical protein n=1 Tax=Streptomyces lavendulae TaxID=1914 RepID=UPI00367FF51A
MRARRGPQATVVALALSSLLTAGCGAEATPAPSTEETQGIHAKGLLEQIPPDSPEFVESGLEKATDGVHARSTLTQDRTYKLSVVCVGTGSVQLTIGEETRPQPVSCNGATANHPVHNPPQELSIDVTAASGATGMIAWQLTALPS